MIAREQNSVAAVLSVFVRVVMWVSIVVGAIAFVFSGLGLAASLNGGSMDLGIDTEVEQLKPATFVTAMVMLLVIVPGVIYICTQLRSILETLAAGDPFVPENAPRLQRIAYAVAGMELGRYAAIIILGSLLDFGDDVQGPPRLSISLVAWVSVAAMLVFSQVFREGSRLREEEKMTI